MKKRICLTVDESVYDGLKEIPRGVSVSEVVSWILKAMIEDVRAGRELTQEEFDEWIEGTPEGQDFRDRYNEKYGPVLHRVKLALNSVGLFKDKVKKKKEIKLV